MRANRDLLRRLLVESHGCREIDMKSIVEHKFSPVPISPATIDGKLNKCCKSDLADIFTEGLDLKGDIPKTSKRLCVLINEAALIQSIGKSAGAQTYGELADILIAKVFSNFSSTTNRVDVLFDRYLEFSIKSATREKKNLFSSPY